MRSGCTRNELWARTQDVIEALGKPATVAEIVARTGIERRTVYRILGSLPEGVTLHVRETPREEGRGRAWRHYQVTRAVTKTRTPPPSPLSPVLRDALRRATVAVNEGIGWARSLAPTAEEITRTVDYRTIRGAASRIVQGTARVLKALERSETALARAQIEVRRLSRIK